MLNRFFELVFCGCSAPCGGRSPCTRWNKPRPDDGGDFWRDLSLLNNTPERRKPKIPRVVRLRSLKFDDISTIYEGSLQRIRSEDFFDASEETLPNDLELRVEEDDEDESTELERRFFAELYSTPLKTYRSQRSHLEGDGSSYSTHRQKLHSWKTESTEATMQTKNTFTPYFTSSQAMI